MAICHKQTSAMFEINSFGWLIQVCIFKIDQSWWVMNLSVKEAIICISEHMILCSF